MNFIIHYTKLKHSSIRKTCSYLLAYGPVELDSVDLGQRSSLVSSTRAHLGGSRAGHPNVWSSKFPGTIVRQPDDGEVHSH